MTDTIKFTALTAAIAASSVTVTRHNGNSATLKIKDIGNLPESIPVQDCPLLAPVPDNFVSNVQVVYDTTGADAALKSIKYDLAYRLFFYPMGEGLKWVTYYGAMGTCAMQILLWFSGHTNNFTASGATVFLPAGLPGFSPQADSAGTPFHGCRFLFHIEQYLEN